MGLLFENPIFEPRKKSYAVLARAVCIYSGRPRTKSLINASSCSSVKLKCLYILSNIQEDDLHGIAKRDVSSSDRWILVGRLKIPRAYSDL